MKLSELTYAYLASVGLSDTHMPTDCSDEIRSVKSEWAFNDAKRELMERYGDVEIVVDPNAPWYDKIKIVDETWQADHKRYCDKKAAWCMKYGCD